MSDKELLKESDYKKWLSELKNKIRHVQIKAALSVNRELLQFYWDLGAGIVLKQAQTQWGDGFITRLSKDLIAEFPEIKGFSTRNIKYIKQWHLFYNQQDIIVKQPVAQLDREPTVPLISQEKSLQASAQSPLTPFGQQVVAQITSIPWGHNIAIISKCKKLQEALYYAEQTTEYNWSRSVLVHQIESGLFHREGKAVTNFSHTLPKPHSDLAQQTLKDPYIFDFLTMSKDYNERDLEKALVDHIAHFLLELGAGFAYLGRQYPLTVGTQDFYIDLLFYHARLHCYVVIELKTGEFVPEHAGKLNFYIKAIDEQLRKEGDAPTIGILLCKGKDKLVAEYALSDIHKPMGVSEYELTRSLPDNLKSSLPSIEEIEAEMSRGESNEK
jgi:predicted nuclease of restriction endonuclease-like (RecB) superfamily